MGKGLFIIHRINMKLRRIFVVGYYKTIYGSRLKMGTNFSFRGSLKIMIDGGGKIQIGDNCFINNGFCATSMEYIRIGDNCIFGEGVKIYDHNHNHQNNGVPFRNQGFTSKEVEIGNNCWIASNVTIFAGVHIGDNCVIGANSLVYKDVPANSIVKHKEELIISERGILMPPKISIIIPVYKVEKYIRRCLDSVLGQTLRDIEVILVDDGSPDKCGQICDEYAARDSRIRVIHKKNAGVSVSRNSGLEIATGDYIGFVDSDDYVASNMFELMYRQAVIADADYSMCEFAVTDGETNDLAYEVEVNDAEIIVLNPKQAFEVIADFSRNVQVTVWNKLYKRELIDNLKFDTHKRMAEDIEFLMKAMVKSKKAVYLPFALYGYYAQRAGAATSHADHTLDWYIESYQNVSQVMDDIAREHPDMANLAIGYKCVNGDMSIANAMVRAGNMDKKVTKIVRNDLRKNLGTIMKSELHTYKKVQMIVFLVSPKLYSMVMKKKLT